MEVIITTQVGEILLRDAQARRRFNAWRKRVEQANWRIPSDVPKLFPNAEFIEDNRWKFLLGGYRLIADVYHDELQIVDARWLGSHARYDRISNRLMEL